MSQSQNKIKFSQLTDNQHVRLRTGMHLGAKQNQEFREWVINKETNQLEKVLISYSPALYKAIDEIIVNAIDHYTRTKTMDKKYKCTVIKCTFDIETGEISIYNNGIGIPVEKFENRDIYIPQVVFTETKTSSNFGDDNNDSNDRITGGLNGYGAKLTNILSEYFIIETLDENKTYYRQLIEDGNEKINLPEIKKKHPGEGFTKITFKLDYKYCYEFDYNEEIGEIIDILLYSRIVHTSLFCNDINVYYNEKKIEVRTFNNILTEYDNVISTTLKTNQSIDPNLKITYNLDVTFALSDSNENFSLLNGIYAKSGGTHIKFIEDLILSNLKDKVEKLFKGKKINARNIFNNIIILVKGYINKPDWKGQQKDELSINKTYFKNYVLENSVYTKLWNVLKNKLNDLYVLSKNKELSKTDGKKKKSVGIEKLFDAENAGTKNSNNCVLILTEGDSASATAICGLSKIGRKNYGVFPLRGKLLNVREASVDKINKNEEFKNIKEILGLKNNTKYLSTDELRYGSIMCMTDADSVSGDTPILIKNKNNQLSLIEIQYLHLKQNNFYITNRINNQENPKSYCHIKDLEIWTDNGWSKIKHVMKHKTNKTIYRITDNNGSVDVTEDHSLLNERSEEIKPREIDINTKLLSSEPNYEINISKYNYFFNNSSNELFTTESYLLGIFFHYGFIKNNLYFVFKTELQKNITLNILNQIYTDIIISEDVVELEYILTISSQYKINKSLIEKYKMLMYYNYDNTLQTGKKNIHAYILFNNNAMIPLKFLMGYLFLENPYKIFKTKFILTGEDKITIQSFYILLKIIEFDNKKLTNIQFGYLSNFKTYEIIINSPETKLYQIYRESINHNLITTVYDIETENHHFHAGIGNLIVHNTDGIHIRGLIINMISFYWPELLNLGFITSMMTPIVRVSKKNEILNFYTEYDYNIWSNNVKNANTYKIKYYKGLGTIQKDLAIELFSNLKELQVIYYADEDAVEKIKLGFDKKYANDRKQWLLEYNPNDVKNHLDITQKNISLTEYIDKELIQFSYYDIHRSIPNVLDGLKPSQRKILYTALKTMKEGKEYKVAQFGPEVAKLTEYHHGEVSLFGAIINMAQDYVGSNNCNLLLPLGQFGSRIKLGQDHAAARYIFTNLNPVTKILFNEDDSVLLTYLEIENNVVEPKYFMPIIPSILLNGSKGIGTGFSTTIYCYNIIDIIGVLLDIINNRTLDEDLVPYYKGFKGTIESIGDGKYLMTGCYKLENNLLHITEIPISTSIEKYKSFLISLEQRKFIREFVDSSTDNVISFKITLNSNQEYHNIEQNFNLTEILSTNNMHCFDACNKIKKYDTVIDIIKYHYKYRNKFYIKRKEYILNRLNKELLILQNKIRFIKLFNSNDIEVRNKKKSEIEQKLNSLDFDKCDNSFNYLLNMSILSLTYEKIKELEKQVKEKQDYYSDYESKTIVSIWKEELKQVMDLVAS